jgi:hypothetical protein
MLRETFIYDAVPSSTVRLSSKRRHSGVSYELPFSSQHLDCAAESRGSNGDTRGLDPIEEACKLYALPMDEVYKLRPLQHDLGNVVYRVRTLRDCGL